MDFLRRILSSQLGQNILTNYLAVAWMGALTLGLIPVYLARLGPEEWGVVALCIAIQGFFGLLDSGLGQIMPRDVARVAGDRAREAQIFRLFTRAYAILGFVGFVLGQLAVPWLIAHWFNGGNGLSANAGPALRLVLVQFLFQFANNASLGFWNGVQAQTTANWRQCLFATGKHALALIAISTWRAEATSYLLAFAFVSFLEWWANRRAVLRSLGRVERSVPVASRDLRQLAEDAGVFAAGVLIGMLVTQVDRIVLSRSVDVASFGRYVIVANLGVAFTQLQYPLVRAYFPRIVQESERGAGAGTRHLLWGVGAMCVLPCALVALLAPWILDLWIGDPETVRVGVSPLRLILLSVASNALYQLVYQQILVRGQGRFLLITNLTALLVVTPTVVWAAPRLGIVAGGLAWVLLGVVQWIFGVWWLRRSRRRASSTGP